MGTGIEAGEGRGAAAKGSIAGGAVLCCCFVLS